MLEIVIETETPENCKIASDCESMVIKQISFVENGKMKALACLKDNERCMPTIIDDHYCELAKVIFNSGAILVSAQVRKGKAIWTLICSWENFKKLISSLNNLKLKYELIWKSKLDENENLNEKEAEILKLALYFGYFDDPKKVKLKDLAEMLDVSEATASTLLRRAIKKALKSVLTQI